VDYVVDGDALPGYPYVHTGANAAHVSYDGAGMNARVEDGGGGGTRGSHWDESVYDDELMTGYVEAEGEHNHLSRITLGALEDLGYVVNGTAATALEYRLPTARRRLRVRRNKKRYNYTSCVKYY
jgi:Leishmanolysin